MKPSPAVACRQGLAILLLAAFLAIHGIGCSKGPEGGAPAATLPAGLSAEQAETLLSLERVDPYPLYTMRYEGAYAELQTVVAERRGGISSWGCSLFAALGDEGARLYGRNFDWYYSPALLLFTDPPNGYAAAAMVDIAYLFSEEELGEDLAALSLEERLALLHAPQMPFDGMNEYGLTVGIAAVPASEMPYDPALPTIDSLLVIRRMLDYARDVEEALDILRSYNLEWGGGPALHYLLADASGEAVLVEYFEGEMVIIPSMHPWHQATNFLISEFAGSALGQCPRYDRMHAALTEGQGVLSLSEALELLADVSAPSGEWPTQWSVIYDMSSAMIHVVMGRAYEKVYGFALGE
jgi:hypothetical protein